jgi:hypothetical protein
MDVQKHQLRVSFVCIVIECACKIDLKGTSTVWNIYLKTKTLLLNSVVIHLGNLERDVLMHHRNQTGKTGKIWFNFFHWSKKCLLYNKFINQSADIHVVIYDKVRKCVVRSSEQNSNMDNQNSVVNCSEALPTELPCYLHIFVWPTE